MLRKGEKGLLVVYANRITKTEANDQGEEIEHEIPFLKGYTVFNTDQIEGLPEHYYAKPPPLFESPAQRIDRRRRSRSSNSATGPATSGSRPRNLLRPHFHPSAPTPFL